MEPPKPGIHEGVPAVEYHRWDAVNASRLKIVREKSCAHARYEQLHPREQTKAMALGEAIHFALLEPAVLEANVVEGLDHDRRSAVNTIAWAAFEEEHPGKIIVKADEYVMLSGLAAEVRRNPTAAGLLEAPGITEASLIWEHEGVVCKGRFDRLCFWRGHNWIVDVKSCRDASAAFFKREVANRLYDLSAAWYVMGAHALDPGTTYRFAFIVVEKEPPYASQVFEASPNLLFEGEHKANRAFIEWAACLESGEYTAYPGGLNPIDLPKWAEVAEREQEAEFDGG